MVDPRDLPPYPAVQYIEHYGPRLERSGFAVMCLARDAKEILGGRIGSMCDTVVGAWIKRWRNWDGDSAPDSLCRYRTQTVPLLGVSRNLIMSKALATSWVIFRQPLSRVVWWS